MRRKREHKSLILNIGIAIIGFFVIAALISNISVIKEYTNRIVKQSIEDEINENNSYINSYINSNISVIESTAKRIALESLNDKNNLIKQIAMSLDYMNFSDIRFIDNKGFLYRPDGNVEYVGNKREFLESYQVHKDYIWKSKDTYEENNNKIEISVPVMFGDKYYGSINVSRDISDLNQHFSSNFDQIKGFICVIDNEGNIVFKKDNNENEVDTCNFYSYVKYNDDHIKNYWEKILEDIKEKDSDVIEISKGKGYGYLGFEKIDSGLGWTSITYINESKITFCGNQLIDKTIEMITSITLLAAISSLYIVITQIIKGQEFKKMAYSDALTGINNQFGFEKKARKCLNKKPLICYNMILFDVIDFKFINYKYGYSYGDKILKKIALAIQKKYNSNEICARLESDLFILMVQSRNGLENEVKECLEHAIIKEIGVINFRFGVYENVNKDLSITDMIDRAKLAWKYIKNDKKKYISYYNDKLLNDILEEQKLENRMQKSLEDNEFKVYFQPKVDLYTDKICGAEALVRWVSKDMGFLSPAVFIPLFEKNGFISKLDFYMLDHVFRFLESMKADHKKLIIVSVNQSRETLNSPNYLERIQKVVEKHRINPKFIELEITESVFVEDHDKIVNIIKELKHIGFNVSMDDFGSGYSSLNLLSEMPIDVLKIDRMFLNGTAKSEKNKIIISSVIDMAKRLGINVICEGVENFTQVNFLKKIKCEMAQGFFYSKPISLEKFTSLLYEQKAK